MLYRLQGYQYIYYMPTKVNVDKLKVISSSQSLALPDILKDQPSLRHETHIVTHVILSMK